ncbi:phage tail tape measure protein [Sphingopyxis indica]|uniref:phage tail tape measure protein n=1 Tax=Sphingopyxis indica TaxID=436663 RepID=UPI0029390D62|nr:phage tail tape measure protein [Sphingopyxis indica]WOF44370.1 phage tail tape measure protein [Sphingopyxis indica]
MVDPTNTQTVDVELLAEGADVSKAMDLINAKIEKALAAVNKISSSADAGAKNFNAKLDRTVKDLQRAMSQLATLEKSMYAGAGDVRQLSQAQQFGKSTEAAARFAGTVKNAGNAVEAVNARINDLTKKMARIGQQDFLPKQKMLRAQEDLRAVDRELRSVDRSMDRLNTKARLSGGDFTAQQRQVAEAQANLFRALRDGRRTNFTNELNQLRDAMARYGVDVRNVDADLRRQGQAYDQLISKARQYANETKFQQEGRLRREAGRLGVPGDLSTEGATERLAAATIRAANAKERLNVELASKAGQAELAKAVADYERYNTELVESVALHNKLQTELKQSAAAQAASVASMARSQVTSQQKGPLGTILSPSYGAAAFARTSVYGAAAMAAYGAFNTLRDGARFVVEFQDALANLQAISAATDGQMVKLRDTILDVSTASKFSTIDLTKAATVLAQAGFSVRETQQSLASVSQLATASGATIAESTDLITSAVGAFQLQASEAARVSDLLVAALNRSKLAVPQVAAAIQYVGATAFESNISLNELVAAAGALANAGVKSGSTIGTGLRQFLVDLQDPTKNLKEEFDKLGLTQADVDVKTRGLTTVMKTLRDAGFGSAQAYAGLETRAAAAFLVLKNNLDTMQDLTLAQLAQGQAAEASATAMDSLSAEWQRFKNVINKQNAESDALQDLQDSAKGALRGISDLIAANDNLAASRLGVYDQTKKNMQQNIDEGRILSAVGDSFKLFGYDVDNAVRSAVGMNQQFKAGAESAEDYATAVANGNETIIGYQATISAVDDAMAKLLLQEDTLRNEHGALGVETAMLATRFEGLSKYLVQNTNDFYGAINAVRQYRAELSATLIKQLEAQRGLLQAQRSQQQGVANAAFREADRNVTSSTGRGILAQLARNPTDPIVRQMALNYAAQPGVSSFEAKTIRKAAESAAAFDTTNRNVEIVGRQLAYARAGQGNEAQTNTQSLQKVTAIMGQLGAEASDMDQKARAGIYDPIAKQAEQAAEAARARAQSATSDGERQFWSDTASQWHSLANQASGAAKPTSAETKAEQKAAAAAQRAAQREARRRLRGDKFVSQAGLKTAELDLKDALSDNTEPLNYSEFKEGKDEIEKALANWIAKRQELMKDEIASKRMGGEEADNYRREIASQIEAKRREINAKIAENIGSMLENAVDAADREFEQSMQPFEDGIKLAEARRKALDRIGVRDSIPDYVRENADFRVEQQTESRDRASISRNETRLARLADAYMDLQRSIESLKTSAQVEDDYRSVIDEVAPDGSEGILVVADVMKQAAEATGNFTDDELQKLTLKLIETATNMHNLRVENDAMRASFEGAADVPRTLAEAFQLATVAYTRTVALNRTMKASIINDLGAAIKQTHSDFTQFWSDMLSRPDQVLRNLKNFALSVVQTLRDMAAQALANNIFSTILNLVGTVVRGGVGIGGGGSVGSANGRISVGIGANFNGGLIERKEGGLVTEGVPNRDSVVTGLARGEFVTQKSAVDSVGVDFMRDLNKRGARALQGLGANVVQLRPSRQEMNVYVVGPEEKPTLGPNDVLAVLDDALMRESSTKKLVKHVSQGG